MEYGIYSLVPPLVVIVLAILMRRSFEALLLGCVAGFLMIDYKSSQAANISDYLFNKEHHFPGNFVESLKNTMGSADMVWVILVCGLYGSLIHLMIMSGGAFAFGKYMLRFIRNRKSALLVTWFTGLLIFIDDYMSALAVGSTLRKVTDSYRIPRETLAYLVNTTAAPICVILPMTTWSIYCGKLLSDNNVVAKGNEFMGYINVIPYVFYGWTSVIIALFFALGWIPAFGKLKKAEARVASGGPLTLQNTEPVNNQSANTDILHKAKPIYFFLPLAVLIISTIILDKEALNGAMVGVSFTVFYYWFIKIMPFEKISDGVFEGFQTMVFPLAILAMSYVLKAVGDEMGLTPYVINSVKGVLSKEMLPFGVFLALAAISYATSSSWGMYAVAIPIVVPVAQALDANVWMTIGAVIGAGAFGSNASFYSDVTVLTSTSTECNNLEHSFSQLPYALLAVAASAFLYLIAGFLF